MKNAENTGETKDGLFGMIQDFKEYINLRIKLIQLHIIEKVSGVLANFIATGIAVLFILLFVLFASFALCYLLGDMIGSLAAGFAIVAGFYLFIAILILSVGKKALRNRFINSFISELSKDETHDTK